MSLISGMNRVEGGQDGGLYAPVNESPSSDHLITLEFSSSLRILDMTSIPMRKNGAK